MNTLILRDYTPILKSKHSKYVNLNGVAAQKHSQKRIQCGTT
jgi:hypothetical protein